MDKTLAKKYAAIKEGMQTLSEQMAELGEEATSDMQEGGEEAMKMVSHQVKDAKEMWQKKSQEVHEAVEENPWMAVAVAAVVGMVVGHVLHAANSRKRMER